MPDTPDYSKYLPNSTRFPLNDMGELAVRLGSLVSYDRRGEVIFADNFAHGLSDWAVSVNGPVSYARLSTTKTHGSPYSIAINAGNTQNCIVQLQKDMGTLDVTSGGIEMCFQATVQFDKMTIRIDRRTSEHWYVIAAQLSLTENTIRIFPTGGSGVVVGQLFGNVAWYQTISYFKLVWDLANGVHKRLLFDDREIPLTDYPILASSPNVNIKTRITYTFYATDGTTQGGYLHHFILTANEP